MELQHLVAPGHLVQPVDVLGDDSLQLPIPFPLGQLHMGGIGPGLRSNELLSIEIKKLLLVALIKRMAQYGLRRIPELLVVQAVHTAEVRDTGLRGHPCPTEKYDVIRCSYHFLQLHHSRLHCISLPFNFTGGFL